jgi:Asp/Glu/hydantoin racemase
VKIGVVYTSTTPELTRMVDESLAAVFDGRADIELLHYQNPSILQAARDSGRVTAKCARDLMDLYEAAVRDGANVLLNVCSSVGDVAEAAKPLYALMGVPLVRIDEDMARSAVRSARRIGVVATLPTTLEPTKRLLEKCAREEGVSVALVDALAEGVFGADQELFRQKLIETGGRVRDRVDALLFAQGSMAYAERAVSEALDVPVFSSIRFGAQAVRAAADALHPQHPAGSRSE